jgi:hypothetical protein
MAFFAFSGWKDGFFGDLYGQGMDPVDFFTQKKSGGGALPQGMVVKILNSCVAPKRAPRPRLV